LVSEYLVRILRIDDNKVVVIYFRMMRTQQGARTQPPSMKRSKGQNAQDWQDEDPLDDTSSYAPTRVSESLQERITEVKEKQVQYQMEEVPPIRVGTTRKNEDTPLDRPHKGAPAL
jgi:hypothetical protein